MVTRLIPPSKYKSPVAIPPGETIKDILISRNMTQGELATRMGRPNQEISYLINGKRAITPVTAKQLEYVLGIKSSFWLNIERDYQETLARLEEETRLTSHASHVKNFPYSEMVKLGLVEPTRKPELKAENLLNFFRVADFNALENHLHLRVGASLFRRSDKFSLSPTKLAIWLRMGEIEFDHLKLKPFNPARFKKQLPDIRSLTLVEPEHSLPELKRICAESGVALLCVPELKGLPVWAITRLLGKNPLIQLSFRYKTIDHFWFSLFHEIGHVLLHKKGDFFIDFEQNEKADNNPDDEANSFASDVLIPPEQYRKLVSNKQFTAKIIQDFAAEIDIPPGIVVGRLQHDGLVRFNYFNDLKIHFQAQHPQIKTPFQQPTPHPAPRQAIGGPGEE
ncbi:MAG: ImmA/IrrE family metallo-endopeptidase [Calditrichaeota bacterium]|nr:ImmA/IrrE family metallo-endopeptidase [Calditrichota bacterium]